MLHTQWLWIHDEWMGAAGRPCITDLNEHAVAMVVVLTVTVALLQHCLRVADLTSNATTRDRLKVCARAKRLCAKLLHKHRYKNVNSNDCVTVLKKSKRC